jgi:GNAT superfamily N-acetyltransferase
VLATLADGTALRVREIRPDDKPQIAAGVAGLSPRSAYRRFHSAKPSLSAAELRYLTEVDGINHYALVALNGATIVAVARFVRLADDPLAAEVAVTVCDEHQGRGIGKALGLLLADAARARGIAVFTADILAENVPARRLMRSLTQRLAERHEGLLDHFEAPLAEQAA